MIASQSNGNQSLQWSGVNEPWDAFETSTASRPRSTARCFAPGLLSGASVLRKAQKVRVPMNAFTSASAFALSRL
jgi:hypothetical protein